MKNDEDDLPIDKDLSSDKGRRKDPVYASFDNFAEIKKDKSVEHDKELFD